MPRENNLCFTSGNTFGKNNSKHLFKAMDMYNIRRMAFQILT